MTGSIFNSLYAQGSYQNDLRQQILLTVKNGQEESQVVLSTLTSFDWDRVCVFGTGTSNQDINRVIGVDWLTGDGYVHDQRQILVFVHNNSVATHLVFRPVVFGSDTITTERLGICFSPENAVFTIRQLSNDVRLLMLPEKSE